MVAISSDGRIVEVVFLVRRDWCAKIAFLTPDGIVEHNAQLHPDGLWRTLERDSTGRQVNVAYVVEDGAIIPVDEGPMEVYVEARRRRAELRFAEGSWKS